MAQATSVEYHWCKGAREDLSNQLRRVNLEETPMYSLLPQSAAPKAVETSWMVDDLPNPDFANPLADGTDLTFDGSYTNEMPIACRLSNKIQQTQRSASVSPIAEQIEVAGPETFFWQPQKVAYLPALKTDIEALIGSNKCTSRWNCFRR